MIKRRRIVQYGIGGFLCLFALLYIFPYIWMVAMSFKPDAEIFETFLHKNFQGANTISKAIPTQILSPWSNQRNPIR